MPILCNDIDSDCEQKAFIKFNELLIEQKYFQIWQKLEKAAIYWACKVLIEVY